MKRMKMFKGAVAVVGAVALIGSLLTNALASQPQPFREAKAPAQVKKFKVGGNLTVTGILHANANMSVYGGLYAHGGFQAWKGILVHNGGVSTDALTVNGPSALKGDTVVTGNLQASNAISGATLSTTGAASIGGQLTANGVNAGAGGFSTTGNINAGAGNIATSGSLTAGQIGAATLTTGTLTTTGGATFGGTGTTTSFNGTVDFHNATVTGIGSVGGTTSTLTVGNSASTSAPLTVQQGSATASIGVNSAGDLTISKGLVAGTDGLFASSLTALNGSGSTPGTLTLTGNPINLTGATNLTGGSDLSLSHSGTGSGATASHLIANGDTDVAGNLPLTVLATTTSGTATYTFAKSYGATPIVVVTPTGDPGDGRYWVSASSQSGFVITYALTTMPAIAVNLNFNYHVIGQ